MAKEPTAEWVLTNIKIGTNVGILGIFVILYLMQSLRLGKFVNSTLAHIAHVGATIGFFDSQTCMEHPIG